LETEILDWLEKVLFMKKRMIFIVNIQRERIRKMSTSINIKLKPLMWLEEYSKSLIPLGRNC